MSFATLAYRIATEPDLAAQIKRNPEMALRKAGIHLLSEELNALKAYIRENPLFDFTNLAEPWITIRKTSEQE